MKTKPTTTILLPREIALRIYNGQIDKQAARAVLKQEEGETLVSITLPESVADEWVQALTMSLDTGSGGVSFETAMRLEGAFVLALGIAPKRWTL